VEGRINYIGQMAGRPRYYVNDASRDVLTLDPRTVQVEDARACTQQPSLEAEGFALFPHESAVSDFQDAAGLAQIYRSEIELFLRELTGADEVVLNSPGVRRSAQSLQDWDRLTNSGRLYNTRPAPFVHVDISNSTAVEFTERWRTRDHGRSVRRFAHYNVWRALSPPPQDLPLTLCDSRTVSPEDLIEADAMMDLPDVPESSYVGLVVRYNPRHRWCYFPDMTRDEVLVFKTHDSEPGRPGHVPHSAFSDPTCPPGVAPRASIEMRGIAYWFSQAARLSSSSR
jgi:hypothetical protein